MLLDVDDAPLEALAAELDALHAHADVRDLAEVQAGVDAGVERFGGIDVVIANAGIASYGSVAEVDPETFRRVIDVNLTGVFHTVRAALPHLVASRGYALVVSSLAAFAAAPGMASYDASKAGVEHFANSLRLEVKHQGVDVGSAHMSWIDTPLVQDAKADSPAFREMLKRLPPPLNRTATVDSCAQAFVAGVLKRKRHVYVPGWVGAIAKARTLVNSPAGERQTLRHVPELLPRMDDDVRRLGRSTSARNVD